MRRQTYIIAFALAGLAGCRRDNVRAVDATPEAPDRIAFGIALEQTHGVRGVRAEAADCFGDFFVVGAFFVVFFIASSASAKRPYPTPTASK